MTSRLHRESHLLPERLTINGKSNNGILAGLLEQAYLEVIPTKSIAERLAPLPDNAYLALTCSPVHGLEPTLQLVETLRALAAEKQLKLVPHIAARSIRDKGHLREILARLETAGVESVFVPGGDVSVPVGEYEGALAVLRDIAEIGHNFEDIGVAAHPEGHPLINDKVLLRLLGEKQEVSTYLVTQMCFDPHALIDWLRIIRNAGVTLPAWIGLPGVADISRLISLSLRIGVGKSVKLLKKQKGLFRKIVGIKPYQPDDLLAELGPYLDDPEINIPGFHLFSFNDVERTERWRTQTLTKLRDECSAQR